jgi:hypothetical protein
VFAPRALPCTLPPVCVCVVAEGSVLADDFLQYHPSAKMRMSTKNTYSVATITGRGLSFNGRLLLEQVASV